MAQAGWTPIVEVGAEGGRVGLYGRRTVEGTWIFSLDRNERTMAEFTDEFSPEELAHRGPMAATWEGGLELLDNFPWARLYPLEVHPEFRDAVWKAVKARVKQEPFQLERWKGLCAN